jgi:hypothetical protein
MGDGYGRDSYDGGPPMRSKGTIVAGLVVAVIVIAGVVLGLWYGLRVVYEPRLVYVGLAAWPPGGLELAAVAIEPELVNNGLALGGIEVLPTGTTLEDTAHRAADQGAAHAILLTLETVLTRPGIVQGETFLIARVTGQGMSYGRADPGAEVEIELAEQQPTPSEALAGIGADGARILIQELMAEIVLTEVVQSWARSEPHTLTDDEQRDANTLVERREEAVLLGNAAAGFFKQCERSGAILADERGTARISCFGEPCAEEYAVDLIPDGRHALVQVERKSCFFFLNQPERERAALVPERLDLISLVDGSRRVLDTAKNYYGFASAAPSGDRVLFVENYGRAYAVVELGLDGSRRRVLRLFQRPERVSFPLLSPDGKHVALLYRRGNEQYRAMVMPAEGGELRELTGDAYFHAWAEVPVGTGGRKAVLAVVVLGADGPPGLSLDHLQLLDPRNGESSATIGGRDFPVSGFAGVRDHSVYFTTNDRDRGCRLGIFDLTTDEVELIDTRACIDSAVLAPDGSIVGIVELPEAPGDLELVRFDPRTRAYTRLTSNDVRERTVVAAFGNRVLFEKAPDMFHVDFPLVNACTVTVDSMSAAEVLEVPDAGVGDAGPSDGGVPDGGPDAGFAVRVELL